MIINAIQRLFLSKFVDLAEIEYLKKLYFSFIIYATLPKKHYGEVMKKAYYSLILVTLNLSIIIYSAESFQENKTASIQPIAINNLLTIIPAQPATIVTELSGASYFNLCISGVSHNDSPKSLINFWHENFDANNQGFFLKFCPTIIRCEIGNVFNNLGSLNRKVHQEAKEACRSGQAFYFPYMQGAIIYHLYKTQQNDSLYQAIVQKQKNICCMIEDNQDKPIGIVK